MRSRTLALVVLLAIGLLCRSTVAQQPGEGPSASLLRKPIPTPSFTPPEKGVIPNAIVERDAVSKQIRRVRGRIFVPGARTPRDAAEMFLRAQSKVLGLSADLSELRAVRAVDSLTGHHFTYQQVYSGLPVFGGELSVHTDKNLAIHLVNHDLLPIAQKARIETPKDRHRAIESAIQAVNSQSGPKDPPQAEAGVLAEKGTPTAVWRVIFNTRSPGATWMVLVDAQTNRAISVQNIAQY